MPLSNAFLPHKITSTRIGANNAPKKWMKEVYFEISITSTTSRNAAKPPMVVSPAAPRDAAIPLKTSAPTIANTGGMPRATKNGAAMAAGVPAPATPSRNPPKQNAMMINCFRLSNVRLAMISLILSMAPVLISIFKI